MLCVSDDSSDSTDAKDTDDDEEDPVLSRVKPPCEAAMMRTGPDRTSYRAIQEEEETPCPGSTIVLDPRNRIYLQDMSDSESPSSPVAEPSARPKIPGNHNPPNLKNPKRKMDYLKVNMEPRIRELSFDIVGPSKDSPFPWQRNIAVQVDISEGGDDLTLRGRSQRSCSESAVRGILLPSPRNKCMRKGYSLDSGHALHKSATLPQRVRSLREEEGVGVGVSVGRGASSAGGARGGGGSGGGGGGGATHMPAPRPTEGIASPPERKRRTAMTEGTVSMHDLLELANSAHKPKR